ncbi:MAG TPA: DUF5985 family protein [Vicinamibacterales bacterium]|nr:DUF5985 family protein [Vicinamibacterales bacterium]
MAGFAYSLCLVTAVMCAVLLTRAYLHSRFSLLFWSALCFWGLSVTNALAVVDRFVATDVNLYPLRLAAGLVSVLVLLFGMVWESK